MVSAKQKTFKGYTQNLEVVFFFSHQSSMSNFKLVFNIFSHINTSVVRLLKA